MLARKKNSISERQGISGSGTDAKASSPQHERAVDIADRSSLPEADFLQSQSSTSISVTTVEGIQAHRPSTENTCRVCF